MAEIKIEQLETIFGTDLNGNSHRLFYTDGSGNVQELAFGASGDVLTANGLTSAPSFQTPSGGGGGGQWDFNTAFAVISGASGRFYCGSTSGGINNESWNTFRSPYTSMRGVEVIRCGMPVPAALSNCGAKGYFWVDGGVAANVTFRLLKLTILADGTSYTNSVTVTQIGSQTVVTTAAQEFWSFDITSATSIAANEVFVFGIDTDQSSVNHFVNVTIYGDY